jgi:RNA polymerase sigma factor for flagellar operon FliA
MTTRTTSTRTASTLTHDEICALVEEHLPLVQDILHQVAAHYPRHADREELAQSGSLGLVEAAHRFDPNRGVPFARWASVRVRGAIIDAARALDFAPRSLRAAARDLDEAVVTLTGGLGRTPSREEITDRLGISALALHQIQVKVHGALVLSLDAPCGEDDGDRLTLADGLVGTSDAGPIDQLEEREQATYLRDALSLLPDRLHTVIEGYFLRGRTSGDLAAELGVTESRVSQIRSEALDMMRSGLQAQFDSKAGVSADIASSTKPKTSHAACRRASYAAALAARSTFAARMTRAAQISFAAAG